jgi:glycine/D-amino acid oxidase-like deaminating enzyme
MQNAERTISTWRSALSLRDTPPLAGDLETDVCIVGAGIAGISIAYELCAAGKKVVVLSDTAIGGGETAQTTAHLASALDDRFYKLEALHGEEGARLAYESHAAAIDRIEALCSELSIDCDFERVDGYLFLGDGDSIETLDRELAAAHRAGLNDAERLSRAPHAPFDTGPCIRFPRQAQFHPLRYLDGLVNAIERGSCSIHCGTHVLEVHPGSPARVVTSSERTVTAPHVVIATNTPINDVVAIHTKQAPYRTFAIALSAPRDSIAPALYWDTGDPYHYVRVQRVGAGSDDLLVVGGEDHKTGEHDDAEERFDRLEAWARARYPSVQRRERAWSGQVLEPIDALAFIGHNPGDHGRVLISTGDSGNGLTHGVIAGMLLRDLILERANPWQQLYEPSRKNIKALGSFADNAVHVAAGYADWLRAPELSSVGELQPEHGALMQRGASKLAVYRDATGDVRACSARCTHLGGVVRWNSAERSWDCPLHGSRFSTCDEVLSGPAVTPLERVSL